MAYLDAKALPIERSRVFDDFSHTTIARFAQSRAARALVSVSSLTISVSFRASVLSFRFCFTLVSF